MNEKELEAIREKLKKTAGKLFNSPNLPDERGVLNGSTELLEKTDGEQFPDELEEQTPQERRDKFKVHKKQD